MPNPQEQDPAARRFERIEDHIATIFKALAAVAVTQAKTAEHIDILTVKSAETQDKLDALIRMWDDWIKDRGAKNGAPAPEPPPAA